MLKGVLVGGVGGGVRVCVSVCVIEGELEDGEYLPRAPSIRVRMAVIICSNVMSLFATRVEPNLRYYHNSHNKQ